jgi:hypothetical protein
MDNMNGQWNGVVELSMDELALVNGGGIWGFVKDAVNWVGDHIDDIGKAVSTGEKIVNGAKKVINFLGKIF